MCDRTILNFTRVKTVTVDEDEISPLFAVCQPKQK